MIDTKKQVRSKAWIEAHNAEARTVCACRDDVRRPDTRIPSRQTDPPPGWAGDRCSLFHL